MKLSHAAAPALAAILLGACATHTSAPARAEQAELDKEQADENARKAHDEAEKARRDAEDAARAQREADEKARFAAQTAAEVERDARQDQSARNTEHVATGVAPGDRGSRGIVAERSTRAGVAEPQATGTGPGVAFAAGSSDLTSDDKARLDDVANSLRAHPTQKVVVEGYGDENAADSDALSRRRADSVAHYLEKRGISSDRIVTRVGARTVTTDDAARRRPLRRGVEISVQ